MVYVVFAVLFVLTCGLASFGIFRPVLQDKHVRNGVNNSDLCMQHFCFELPCDRQEAIRQLCIRNVQDALTYTYDADSMVISFGEQQPTMDCRLTFYLHENKTYLKVSRIRFVQFGRGEPLFLINRFFINKIGAIPVAYADFEALVCSGNR